MVLVEVYGANYAKANWANWAKGKLGKLLFFNVYRECYEL